MDIVLPRLTKILSAWELLLAKVCRSRLYLSHRAINSFLGVCQSCTVVNREVLSAFGHSVPCSRVLINMSRLWLCCCCPDISNLSHGLITFIHRRHSLSWLKRVFSGGVWHCCSQSISRHLSWVWVPAGSSETGRPWLHCQSTGWLGTTGGPEHRGERFLLTFAARWKQTNILLWVQKACWRFWILHWCSR